MHNGFVFLFCVFLPCTCTGSQSMCPQGDREGHYTKKYCLYKLLFCQQEQELSLLIVLLRKWLIEKNLPTRNNKVEACSAVAVVVWLNCDINEHMVPLNYYFIWVGCVYTIFYPCKYVYFLLFLTTEGLLMVGSLRSVPAQDCWASCPYIYRVFTNLFTSLFFSSLHDSHHHESYISFTPECPCFTLPLCLFSFYLSGRITVISSRS